MVVLLLSVMGAALVEIQAARTRREVMNIDTVRSLYVAEAGLSEAFLAVAEGKSGNVGSQSQPASFGGGIYWVEAAENADGQVALVSNALCGVGRFSLALVLQREVNPVGTLGFFGEEDLQVGSGAIVDGFDSRDGTFDEQIEGDLPGTTTGEGARMGSNGEIQIEYITPIPGKKMLFAVAPPAPTIVYGEVRPGPDSTVVLDPGAIVTGSTAPAATLADLPPITVPELATAECVPEGALTGSAAYETVLVTSGSELLIDGPATLAIGAFVLEQGASLVLDGSDGPITIYCTGYLSFAAGSSIQCTVAEPVSCAILVSAVEGVDHSGDGVADPAMTVRSTGDLYAMVYAPDASLSVPKTLRIYGSIAAQSLHLEPGARISFDRSLAFEVTGIAGLPTLISWHVVALPDTPIVDLRIDPDVMLAANGITAVPSSEAHLERTFTVQYMDVGGSLQTYTGAPQSLAWNQVGQILSVDWFDRDGDRVDPFTWIRDTLDRPVQTTYDDIAVNGTSPKLLWAKVQKIN